jgi:hypothetical protein
MIQLTEHERETKPPVWTVLSSEVLTTNEGWVVRRTVLSNCLGETRVRVEPIPADTALKQAS